jgi:demethylmenaquinone methyltransferase/2-methoxy-6-polyprenyl-1,4-benzoquinol methylase
MTNKEKALKEIYRVLSPGGKLVILEFSKIWDPLRKVYDNFSFKIVPKLGKLFAKDEKSYKYLVESIRMHPDQNTLLKLLKSQGFEKTSFTNLSAGIVAIHKGYKF